MFFINKMVIILVFDFKYLYFKLVYRKLDCCMLDIDDLFIVIQINIDIVKYRVMIFVINVKVIGVFGLI